MSAIQNLKVEFSAEQVAQVEDLITSLQTNMDFLVNLSPDERVRLRKMGHKRTSFVIDSLQAAQANRQYLPATFDLENFQNTYQVHERLQRIQATLRPFMEALDDTVMATGSQAMGQADIVYRLLQAMQDTGNLDETVDYLSQHHKREAARDVDEIPAEPTPLETFEA
jgi:conjugal transfer/entry exclusion protein